jgi:hypothetical protein
VKAFAAELEKRIRPHLKPSNASWRVDVTYLKVRGKWLYLYRTIDSQDQTLDFLLCVNRVCSRLIRMPLICQPPLISKQRSSYLHLHFALPPTFLANSLQQNPVARLMCGWILYRVLSEKIRQHLAFCATLVIYLNN